MGSAWFDWKSTRSPLWGVLFSSIAQRKRAVSQSNCDLWRKMDPLWQSSTFCQWLNQDEAPRPFPKPYLYPKKVMVTVWWSAKGVIHYSFLKPGETINAHKYTQEIIKMHQKLGKLQPALVNRKGPILLHDNARPHVAKHTLQKLNNLGYETLPHPPYSPDLSPTDYHFFKHLDNFLKEKIFNDHVAAEIAFEEFIVSRNQDFFCDGINKLVSRWQRCVDSNGFYFE